MAGGLQDLTVRVGLNLSAFEAGMKKLEKQMKRIGSSMQQTGKTMSASITAPLVAIGGLSVKTFADFELGMAKVKAITGATGSEFAMLQKNAEDLGASTKFTATQVSELQLELGKLGLNPKQITDSTDSILALAQAFDQDLGESAAVAAKTMNAFGLEATDMGHITDVMAKSFGSSALDMQAFGDAMQYAGAAGKASGASLEEVTAMIGTLADSGINASAAGTSLRKMFIVAAESGKDLNDMLKEINGSQNKLAAASAMFGKTAANQALILAENASKVRDLSTAFENADGTAKAMQKTMDNTLAGGMAKMKSALEAAAITIGKNLAPMVASLAGWIAELANKFKGLSPETQRFILIAAGIAAAIGPVLFIVGKLIGSFGKLIGVIGKVSKVLMANPWMLAVAGVIALGVAIYDLTVQMDENARAKEALASVQSRTMDLAGEEIANLEILKNKILDTSQSTEERTAALEELRKKYPGYIGNMTLEQAMNGQLVKSTNAVSAAILRKAKTQAIEEELVKLMKEQVKLQMESTAAGKKAISPLPWWKQLDPTAVGIHKINKELKEATGMNLEQMDISRQLNKNKIAADGLTEMLADLKQGSEELGDSKLNLAKDMEEARKASERMNQTSSTSRTTTAATTSKVTKPKKVKTQAQIDAETNRKAREEDAKNKANADKQIQDMEIGFASRMMALDQQHKNGRFKTEEAYQAKRAEFLLDKMIAEREVLAQNGVDTTAIDQQIALKRLEQNKLANDAELAQDAAKAAMKRQILGDSLDAATSVISGLQQLFGKSKALAIAQIAVDTAKGISGAIATGITAGPFPKNIAAIGMGIGTVLSAAGQAKAVLSGAPAFAEGGMVTGPMMAMVGDNPSGKEAIIPFEKMGKFLNMANGGGGGGGYPSHVTLTARGEDLVAVLNKANRSKSRAT